MDTSDDDKNAITAILSRQTAAWAVGDAIAFGDDTKEDVIFTNVIGMFSIGKAAFNAQHAQIFSTIYHGSKMTQELAALTFVRSDVAIVDTIAKLVDALGHPPGIELIDGVVQTRLEQVMVREKGEWKVASFHNVAVHPASLRPMPPH